MNRNLTVTSLKLKSSNNNKNRILMQSSTIKRLALRQLFPLSTLLILLSATPSIAGESIDGTIEVGDKTRGYSLYVPTGYDALPVKKAMLAMHPFNPSRWDAKAWRDTLINFADRTGLLLICPDSGPGGNILDEDTDTALATRLLDTMLATYNVDLSRVYIGGFSMGGGCLVRFWLGKSYTNRWILDNRSCGKWNRSVSKHAG